MLIAIAIAEEIQGLQRSALLWCQNPAEDLLGLSAPHEPIFFEDLLRLPPGLHAQNNKISNLSENTTEIYPSSNQYDSNFLSKSKKTLNLKTL